LTHIEELHQIAKTTQRGQLERVYDVPRLRLKRDKIFTFCRLSNTNVVLNSSTATPVGYAFAPSLSNFPNATDFTNLFEQWRIVQATWIFTPLYSGTVAQPIYTWFDPDDDTTPIGLNEPQQQETLRVTPSGGYVERTFTPQTSLGGFATGSISGYGAGTNGMWMDDGSPGNRYYGCKAVIPVNSGVANGVPLYSVEVSAVIQCRRPK